jgi:diguanylate cyclase (GGDEF)-like protein
MGTPLRVLIVEDSEDDALLLARHLKKGGYELHSERVESSETMRSALELHAWDLVIADHNLPCFNSTAALKVIRDMELDIPFIIVSGSIGEEHAVSAMKAGAHDYLMKDNLVRLVPAVQRELREAQNRSAHKQAEQAIRHMAYHDALTDLVNRREFEHRLEQAILSAKERELDHVLLYLDLDQFKIINDTCGHMAGDDLLRQLAVLFQEHVRDNDTLARLGGDEFGILLESCPLDRAERIAENLRQAINNYRFVWRERPFGLSVSIGLVAISSASQGIDEIHSAADMACYAAKDLGRNRVHIYRAGDMELARRHGDMQWASRIKEALEQDRFTLYCQSIVPLDPNVEAARNFECLLRLNDESGNIISPGAFIPAAEHYNLMPALDRWVIDATFSHLASIANNNGGLDGFGTCFINLSGNSLNEDSFFPFIHEQLHQHQVSPRMICFEITETAAISNLSRAVEFIKEIKSEGCKFALDDFGAGLSSFSYLRTIPVDFLKIDGRFVQNMMVDSMDSAIVAAINFIGDVAGVKTIAESVENIETQRKLQSIGVNYAQGYGIEHPRPLVLEAVG